MQIRSFQTLPPAPVTALPISPWHSKSQEAALPLPSMALTAAHFRAQVTPQIQFGVMGCAGCLGSVFGLEKLKKRMKAIITEGAVYDPFGASSRLAHKLDRDSISSIDINTANRNRLVPATPEVQSVFNDFLGPLENRSRFQINLPKNLYHLTAKGLAAFTEKDEYQEESYQQTIEPVPYPLKTNNLKGEITFINAHFQQFSQDSTQRAEPTGWVSTYTNQNYPSNLLIVSAYALPEFNKLGSVESSVANVIALTVQKTANTPFAHNDFKTLSIVVPQANDKSGFYAEQELETFLKTHPNLPFKKFEPHNINSAAGYPALESLDEENGNVAVYELNLESLQDKASWDYVSLMKFLLGKAPDSEATE